MLSGGCSLRLSEIRLCTEIYVRYAFNLKLKVKLFWGSPNPNKIPGVPGELPYNIFLVANHRGPETEGHKEGRVTGVDSLYKKYYNKKY